MRILMITSDFYDTGYGGVEGHILGLSRALTSAGHEVVVLRAANRAVLRNYDAADDGIEYRVLDGMSRSRGAAKRMRVGRRVGLVTEFIRRFAFGVASRRLAARVVETVGPVDVVHQHNFLESWGLTRSLAAHGTPVIWTNHLGEYLYLRKLPLVGARLLRWLTEHYVVAVGPSAELADQGVVGEKITLIANGVDTSRFRPCLSQEERSELRAEFGWPQDRQVVIVPRRWAPTKGVVYAAAAASKEEWPEDIHVVFAGSGTQEYPGYRREIEALLKRARCSFEVHESVSQDAMARMLRTADVCLIPSVKEATSLSALEAMASGTVVVAAAVGGLPEIIDHEVTGFLHRPHDPVSIATSVRAALRQPEEMAVEARAFVVAGYSWDRVAEQTTTLYKVAQCES